jgi:trigger factor
LGSSALYYISKEQIAVSEVSDAVKIEDISPVKKRLTFDIPWAQVKSEMDSAYRKIGKTAKVKGFRPGKIPMAVLERNYRELAEEETVSNLVNKYYWETLEQKDIPAIAQPAIEQKGIEKDKDFSFSATFEVEPIIIPKDYLGIDLQQEDSAVSDADLDARLLQISEVFATMEDLEEERGVIDGDFVLLDFSGKVNGDSLKELKAEDHLLEIGAKRFIPGFEEQLIGMKKEEKKSIVVTFPESYHARHLAGKEAEFTIHIKGIRVKKVPKIDEEFIKNYEKFDSLDALKDEVRSDLGEEKKQRVELNIHKQVGERLLEANDFTAPETFIETQIYYMMADMQRRMVSGGMDRKKAAEFSFKFRDQLREEATKTVKTALLIKNIARIEGLTVDDAEVEKQIEEMATQRAQDYHALKTKLEKSNMTEDVRSEILSRKTYAFLIEKARITTISAVPEIAPEGEK